MHRLIREGVLPATQLMPSAPWKIPVEALETEAVKTGVQAVAARRPKRPWIHRGNDAPPAWALIRGMHYVTQPPDRVKILVWDGTARRVLAIVPLQSRFWLRVSVRWPLRWSS